MNLSRKDLVAAVAEKTGMTKKDVEAVLKAEYEAIPELINSVKSEDKEKNGKLQITGFGTFKANFYPARKGTNPKNGEEIDIEASYRISFTAGKDLKEALNK